MIHFVFCHGFGFDIRFWERLAPYFSKEKCTFIDLGYFKNPTPFSKVQRRKIGQKTIGIGHSLGLLKLMTLEKFLDGLIGLNSFVNFLDSPEKNVRKQEFRAFQRSFLKDPRTNLINFYRTCGVPKIYRAVLEAQIENRDDVVLESDLNFLVQAYAVPSVKTLILTSCNDLVVPQSVVHHNFQHYAHIVCQEINGGGHVLGLRKPAAVYAAIMNFVDQWIKENANGVDAREAHCTGLSATKNNVSNKAGGEKIGHANLHKNSHNNLFFL